MVPCENITLLIWSLMCAGLIPVAGMAQEGPVRFSHPDRIRYDGQCFTIEGKDTFLYSGAFHYFRCPRALWPDRFRKIKEAGFNAVETYVPWNWHEREMPDSLDDYSKVNLRDLNEWLTMAHEQFGLHTIVRPGPYICAEWDVGGLPRWICEKVPAEPGHRPWTRSDDPQFIAWSRHWFHAVCPVIAAHQITRQPAGKAGVILVQLENEYDYSGYSEEVKLRYLRALAEAAVAEGIEVPLFTCWTRPARASTDPVVSQVFDTCNFYPRWGIEGVQGALEQLRREQPHAPLMVTELQGGWFSNVGGQLSEDQDGLSATQIRNLTLYCIQNGLTALNYYMLFGGTNLQDWAARNITTTYDYYAPVRECGGVGAKYRAVKALGLMLRQHGPALARSVAVDCDVSSGHGDIELALRRAPDGSAFVFIRSRSGLERQGTAQVHPRDGGQPIRFGYELMPHDSRVLYLPPGAQGTEGSQWLPEELPAPAPVMAPPSVVITEARRRDDPGEADGRPLTPGTSLNAAAIQDNGFLLYRSRFALEPEQLQTAPGLQIRLFSPDGLTVVLNGQLLGAFPEVQRQVGVPCGNALQAADNKLVLLYENQARPNGGVGMEDRKGVAQLRLVPPVATGLPLTQWRIRRVPDVADRPELAPDFDDSGWEQVTVKTESWQPQMEGNGTVCVFRTTVELSAEQLQAGLTQLQFDGLDDHGWVYVNGNLVGEGHDWRDAFTFDASGALHLGRNVIAVVVRNDQGPGGIHKDVRLARPDDLGTMLTGWELARPAGVSGRWFAPDLDDSGWQKVPVGEAGPPTNPAVLTWYRLRFELPVTPNLWIPWRLRLEASGNGFLYLNGEGIGRTWQAGPQRDFYLPECWLRFGPGQVNVLALCLRDIGQGTALHLAEVRPCAEFAERR